MRVTTNLRKTNKKSISLATQVPREVMNTLGLSEKDKMDWIVEAGNNELVVRVEKAVE